jgi:hypothetical protein
MLIQIVLLGALSGDVAACPDQAPRLNAIAAALERRPKDATLYYWEAATWAQCGQLKPTLGALARTREYGAGFLPIRPMGFESVWSEPDFQEEYAAFARALPKVNEQAPVAFTVYGRDLIPEGVAHDHETDALYLGSTLRGQIIRVRGGKQQVFADRRAGLANVLGLAIDARRRRLYAVNTNVLWPAPGVGAPNEVVVFDIDKDQLIERWTAPKAGQLNDVTIDVDGAMYVSDSRTGAVYRGRAGAEASLEDLTPAGSLGGANGVAMGEGDLFVAHATGVARVDTTTGAVTPLTNPVRETVAAIDGLYWYAGKLIGVQNATNPGRVIEIALDDSRTQVTRVRTLLSHHHPALNEPTTGAVAGDRFLVLANSYIGMVDEAGKVRDPNALRDPIVLAVELGKQ